MKSQVNALLHVTKGVITDVTLAYPELGKEFARDYRRLALLVDARGLGVYTFDLPHLESLLLKGLEYGRLTLEGPLSQAVSKRTNVPRLFSGLWLRVFNKDSSLKQDVDVTALFFLRQLLVLGKKTELDCSYDRVQAIVGAYHDIERQLRSPSLDWFSDSLQPSTDVGRLESTARWYRGGYPTHREHCHLGSVHSDHPDFLDGSAVYPQQSLSHEDVSLLQEGGNPASSLHLVQALCVTGACTENDAPLLPLEGVSDAEFQELPGDSYLLGQIQQVADLVVGSMDELNPVVYSDQLDALGHGIGFRHGPGAVAERKKNHEKSCFPNWPRKLQVAFPFDLCGRTVGDHRELPHNHEVASRLITVPKTLKAPRLIAAEPIAHQWCQQLVLSFFFNQCKRLFKGDFIDFRDQSKSGDLVLEASKSRLLTTVDLSDASDRLSCWTVERVFRSNASILFALHAARTRLLRDDISKEPSFLRLKKFASQGTAVTFPVMSLTMLCIALGSLIEGEVTWSKINGLRTQVRVFGDDIIVPVRGYARLVRAMELLQLKVNMAKSYIHGHFRESCGVDGYMGYDVTPCKPKTLDAGSPASCQAVVDTSNNLFNKGLWNASRSALDLVPPHIQRGLRIVDRHGAGVSGLYSYSGGTECHLRKRWNQRLHRYEVRVWSVFDQARKGQRDGFPALLDFVSRRHSHEQARTVSEFAGTRKTKGGLRWEPSHHYTRVLVLD